MTWQRNQDLLAHVNSVQCTDEVHAVPVRMIPFTDELLIKGIRPLMENQIVAKFVLNQIHLADAIRIYSAMVLLNRSMPAALIPGPPVLARVCSPGPL